MRRSTLTICFPQPACQALRRSVPPADARRRPWIAAASLRRRPTRSDESYWRRRRKTDDEPRPAGFAVRDGRQNIRVFDELERRRLALLLLDLAAARPVGA